MRMRSPISVLVWLPVVLACSEPAAGPPDARYNVRGEIRQLPDAKGRQIFIRHEAVPELRDSSGKVIGMASMTMPFALGADVDRSKLEVGQRISFDLEIRWKAHEPVTVSHVEALPAGTRLEFDPPEVAIEPEDQSETDSGNAVDPADPAGAPPAPVEGDTPK